MDRQLPVQRPPYLTLQTQTQSSSAFNSSSSLSSVSPRSSMLTPSTPSLNPSSSAPLPSPTSQHSSHYFPSVQTQQLHHLQPQYQGQPQAQQYVQHLQPPSHHQQSQSNSGIPVYGSQPGRPGPGQTAHETVRYLGDYNLVAEAARRAQMAVLTRDMEGVELR